MTTINGAERYKNFLSSPTWPIQREHAFAVHGRNCNNCGDKQGIQVHHLNYRNLVDVTPADLIPLCQRCHHAVHDSRFLCKLWHSPTGSEQKRRDTLIYLASRDEALTPEPNKLIEHTSPVRVQQDVYIRLAPKEARRIKMNRERWHWMRNNGVKPTVKGWQDRLVGVSVPASIF